MFTGTVSLVSACSALISVVWMRWSIQDAMVSTKGMMTNTPGPQMACSLPRRSSTTRSQQQRLRDQRSNEHENGSDPIGREGAAEPRDDGGERKCQPRQYER
jgi:hypothetical protein